MGLILRDENINQFVKDSSTVVSLDESVINIASQQFDVNTLPIDLANGVGVGGIDAGAFGPTKLYYVYAVNVGGSVGAIASLSEVGPTGFISFKKIGAFITNFATEIHDAYSFETQNDLFARVLISGASTNLPDGTNVFVNFTGPFTTIFQGLVGLSCGSGDVPGVTCPTSERIGFAYPGFGNARVEALFNLTVRFQQTVSSGDANGACRIVRTALNDEAFESGGVDRNLEMQHVTAGFDQENIKVYPITQGVFTGKINDIHNFRFRYTKSFPNSICLVLYSLNSFSTISNLLLVESTKHSTFFTTRCDASTLAFNFSSTRP